MGHYYSEMTGPPFEIEIICELSKKEEKKLEKIVKIHDEVLKNKNLSNLRLSYNTITGDKTRRWFEIHYSIGGGNFCFSLGFNEISKYFGNNFINLQNDFLEIKRTNALKNY